MNYTKQQLACKQRVRLMLVALILPDEIESILVKVETNEWLHCQDKVRQIERMLDLLAIQAFYFKILIVEFDILVNAIVHYLHLIKSDKLSISI